MLCVIWHHAVVLRSWGFELADYVLKLNNLGNDILAELEDSLIEIAQVLEKIIVVGINKLLPLELRIACFWSSGKQVVSPDIWLDSSVLGVVAEHTNSFRLAEFAVLVVEIFCCGQLVNHGPLIASSKLRAREDNSVKLVCCVSDEKSSKS